MDLGDGEHAAIGFGQRLARLGRGRAVRLKVQEGRDELERIADPVVDLAHQHLALGRERLEPVARLDDGPVGRLLLAPEPPPRDGGADRGFEEFDELSPDILDDIVDRPGLERRDRDPALVRAGDEDHGRRIRQRPDRVEHVEPVAPRHVMIERHRIDPALGDPR